MEKEYLIELLDLFKVQLKNDSCTKEQEDALYHALSEVMPVGATADDIAEHFGKSRDAVHSIIKKKMFSKPRKNITLYNFKEFCKRIPSSWRKKR